MPGCTEPREQPLTGHLFIPINEFPFENPPPLFISPSKEGEKPEKLFNTWC